MVRLMSRTRPRHSRARTGRIAVTLLAVSGLGVGLVSCSSSGSPSSPNSSAATGSTAASASSATAGGSTPDPVSSPPAPPSSTPFATSVPSPTTTAQNRRVRRPAGAASGGFDECTNGGDTIARFMQSAVFGAVNKFIFDSNLRGTGRLATKELPVLRSARSQFQTDGYPATHPVVQDITDQIAAVHQLQTVIARRDLTSLSAVFLRLSTAQDQYGRDLDAAGMCR